MKILLIYPKYPDTFWSFKYALKFISKKAAFPPLGLLTVAALLPEAWDKRLIDLNVRKLKDEDLKGAFDLAVSNPPYRKIGSGRVNPDREKSLARHEINASLEDVLRTACRLLRDKGRLDMIYPASRGAEVLKAMAGFHLEPKRLRFVHSHGKPVGAEIHHRGHDQGEGHAVPAADGAPRHHQQDGQQGHQKSRFQGIHWGTSLLFVQTAVSV